MLSISPFWILLSWVGWSSGVLVVVGVRTTGLNAHRRRIVLVLACLIYGWMLATIPVWFRHLL